jgi:hypothetical protein
VREAYQSATNIEQFGLVWWIFPAWAAIDVAVNQAAISSNVTAHSGGLGASANQCYPQWLIFIVAFIING